MDVKIQRKHATTLPQMMNNTTNRLSQSKDQCCSFMHSLIPYFSLGTVFRVDEKNHKKVGNILLLNETDNGSSESNFFGATTLLEKNVNFTLALHKHLRHNPNT